jgi:serine/threonine protein kinase/Flp pilus assembly protein TadD
MTSARPCPDVRDWQRLLAGLAGEEEAVALERHLEGCAACLRALRDLPDADSLAAALHGCAAGPGFDPEVEEAADRLIDRVGGVQAPPGETVDTGGRVRPAWVSDEPGRPPEAEPGLDLRGYELIEALGKGGMGEVYRCGDPALGRDLAIKVMKAKYRGNSEAEHRFLREARVTGSLQHPGIVAVHNLGRLADGRLHYTMRLVRGRTFAEILKDEGGKPERLPSLLGVFEKVCQAVAYAHSKRVIHRDLKPANVMIGRFGEVQVMDWGLAKLLSGDDRAAAGPPDEGGTVIRAGWADTPPDETRLGSALGTPAYMSPEQAAGDWEVVDERADVFALGAILCEMLTGTPLYRDQDRNELLRRARRGDLAEALGRLEGCGADAGLVALCRDCLAPEREGRPRQASIVAQRVADYQAEVQERLRQAELERTEAVVKVREERKRRRWMIAALLLLLAGAAASTTLALWATKAEVETKAALAGETKAWKRTWEALNTLTDEVLEELLGKQTVLGEKEKSFLRKALEFYERFAAERGEGEESRAVAAEGQFRVARLREFLGETAEAEAGYHTAARLYEKLTSDFPSVPEYRHELARSNRNLGNRLADRGKGVEAETAYRQALVLQEKLVADFPAVPPYRQYLAYIHHALGNLLRGRGNRTDAEAEYRKALALLEGLAGDFPAMPRYRHELGSTHGNLGALLADLGKGAKAEAEYRKALELQEKLASEFPAEPDYHRYLAYSYNDLGRLLADLGKGAAAEKAHRQALALREKLAGDFPAVPQYRLELARGYGFLGLLLRGRQGKGAEAEAAYRQALTLLEKLVADFPTMPQYRKELAYHYLGRGVLLANLGKPAAETEYRKAITMLERLVREFPAEPEYRQELAHSHNNLGAFLGGRDKGAEAEAEYGKALVLRKKLADDFPAMPAYRIQLGGSYANFGYLHLTKNQPQDALDWYAKAIPLLQSALAQDARLAEARLFLRNVHGGRARALDQLGRHAESSRDWLRAAELDDGPSRSFYRLGHSAALARAGEHRTAVKAVEDVLASSNQKGKMPPSGPLLYDAACVYALSATAVKNDTPQREQYAARAIALLRQAMTVGFFKDPKQVEHFKKDSDLDTLRQRDDYKKFASELATQGKPH